MAERFGNSVVFQNWDGGEYGILDPGHANLQPQQMFTGINVIRYRSAMIGPRPGLRGINIANLPSSVPLQQMDPIAQGDVGLGAGPWFEFMAGDEMYQVSLGALTTGAAYTTGPGTKPAALTKPVPYGGQFGSGSLILSPDEGLFLADHTSQAWGTAPGTTPRGDTIGFFGLRFCASDSDNNNGNSRMYFSDAFPGWGVWGSDSFYDIGSSFGITTLRPFREGLLIGKNSGEVYWLNGTLGGTATVRNLSNGGAAAFEPRGLVVDADLFWFMGKNKNYPTSFNGALHEDYDFLDFTDRQNQGFDVAIPDDDAEPQFRMLVMPWLGTNDFIILSKVQVNSRTRMMQYAEGIFSQHQWDDGIEMGAWGVSLADPNAATGTPLGLPQRLVLCDDQSGSEPAFYWYIGHLDRPAFATDDYANVGDDTNDPFEVCEFFTPEWWHPEGHEVRVQRVIVDYRAWDTGSSENAQFNVTIEARHRVAQAADDPVANLDSQVLPGLDADLSNFSTSGTDGSVAVGSGDTGYSRGFRIKISDLSSCAIKRITVVLDKEHRRP